MGFTFIWYLDLNTKLSKEITRKLLEKDFILSVLPSGISGKVLRILRKVG